MPVTQMASKYSPLKLPGCGIWLKFATGSVTITGAGVSEATDKTGNGWSPVQATDGNRIPWVASAINGRPGLSCDASVKWLRKTGLTGFANITGCTVISVINNASTAAVARDAFDLGLRCMNIVAYSTYCYSYISSNTEYGYYYGFGTGNKIMLQIYDGTQATDALKYRIYENGTEKALTFSGVIPANLSDKIADLNIGQGGLGSPWNGYLSEYIMYPRVLAQNEWTQLIRFLGAYYGITVA